MVAVPAVLVPNIHRTNLVVKGFGLTSAALVLVADSITSVISSRMKGALVAVRHEGARANLPLAQAKWGLRRRRDGRRVIKSVFMVVS